MTRIALLLLTVLELAAAGCGSSNDDKSSSSSSSASPSTSSDKGETGKEVEIKMQGFAFTPANLTVKVGQTVKWENEDPAPHNATGDGIKTKTINKGQEVTFKATKAGTFHYICTVHPNMHGTLTVTS
jgi:plastocyanin